VLAGRRGTALTSTQVDPPFPLWLDVRHGTAPTSTQEDPPLSL